MCRTQIPLRSYAASINLEWSLHQIYSFRFSGMKELQNWESFMINICEKWQGNQRTGYLDKNSSSWISKVCSKLILLLKKSQRPNRQNWIFPELNNQVAIKTSPSKITMNNLINSLNRTLFNPDQVELGIVKTKIRIRIDAWTGKAPNTRKYSVFSLGIS